MMCVWGGTKIISALLLSHVIFTACSPFRSGNPNLAISSHLTNCKNVIYFPNVEYPVLASNIGQSGYDNTQNYGPFRPKNCVTSADEEDESYKDPKWWKTFAEKLKSNKATEDSDVANISGIPNSVQAQNIPESTSSSTATGASQQAYSLIDDITSSSQTPEVIKPVAALTDNSANLQSLMTSSVKNSYPVNTESKSYLVPLSASIGDFPESSTLPESSFENLTSTPNCLQSLTPNSYAASSPMVKNSETLSSVSTKVLEYIPSTLSSNVDQGLLPTFSDSSSLLENNQLNTLEDVNTAGNENNLSPLDSVASAITNLILNPTSVQKRTPTNDTGISDKASFVWMAIPYVDENSTASVIPLVVLKFPPVVINNSLADNSTIEKIVVDSLKKQDVQDIISATKIKEALLNKTIDVVDYYQPLSDSYDSILELTNRTEANITTTDNTYAFLVDKSNSTSLLIDKIKNEVIKSKEVKPDSIAFYVNDLLHNTTENTTNNTETSISNDKKQNITNNIDRTTVAEKKPKEDSESEQYFKTIVIKIIRKSDNLTDSKSLDIGDVNYKTDNLVIQIVDEKTDV